MRQRRGRPQRHHRRAAGHRRARSRGGPRRSDLPRLVNPVRLARGVPRHVRSRPTPQSWSTEPGELAAAVGPSTAAVLLMGPAMPTGALLTPDHLDALAGPVRRHGAWVIYDAAMERLRF